MSMKTPHTTPSAGRSRGRAVVARRRSAWLWIVAGLALVGLLIIAFVLTTGGQLGPVGEIAGVQTFADIAAGHQEGPITYAQTPPAGGPHNPAWQNCGTYNLPVANENAVHSLEHGAVWITYRPDLSPESIEQLKSIARGRGYVLLSPYPDLPSPVVASAWGVQLAVDSADDPRLPQFIRKYVQGPQTPEPGAPCFGGVSSAIRSEP
jgi:hypothetical protein